MVHACSPADAKIIDDHTKLLATRSSGGAAQFTDVKAAFERNYPCLGITCADVGGLALAVDQATGQVTYNDDAEPCVESPPPPPPPAPGAPGAVINLQFLPAPPPPPAPLAPAVTTLSELAAELPTGAIVGIIV